jgi:hypothetical protein
MTMTNLSTRNFGVNHSTKWNPCIEWPHDLPEQTHSICCNYPQLSQDWWLWICSMPLSLICRAFDAVVGPQNS